MGKRTPFLPAIFVLTSLAASGSPVLELQKKIFELPWTGAGARALELYKQAETSRLQDQNSWFKLGLALYDGGSYRPAMACFERITSRHPGCCASIRFGAVVWQGHLFDLLGRRREALRQYRKAESMAKKQRGVFLRHDQYGLVLDANWVRQRLASPFVR